MNLLDLVLILIIVFIAFLGASRGFFKSLIGLVTYAVSILASKLLSVPIADKIYSSFVQTKITDILHEKFPTGSLETEVGSAVDKMTEQLPEIVQQIISNFSSAIQSDATQQTLTVGQMESRYIAPVLTKIIAAAAMVVVFIICSIIVKLILNAVNRTLFAGKKQTFLSTANKSLGFVLGLFKGIVIVFVVSLLINVVSPFINNETINEYTTSSALCGIAAKLL